MSAARIAVNLRKILLFSGPSVIAGISPIGEVQVSTVHPVSRGWTGSTCPIHLHHQVPAGCRQAREIRVAAHGKGGRATLAVATRTPVRRPHEARFYEAK